MALLLVNKLVFPFNASKYRDAYRDKLNALIEAKLHARTMSAVEQRRPAPVVNILDALRRSLESDRGKSASQTPVPPKNKTKKSRTKQRSANDTEPGWRSGVNGMAVVKTQHENAGSPEFGGVAWAIMQQCRL